MPRRGWSLVCIVAAGVLAAACGETGTSTRCVDAPGIPKVGTTGFVTASPVPEISGYRVAFRGRDWQGPGTAASPSAFVGPGVVVPRSPFPALRVTRPSSPPLYLSLLPIGCD